MLYCLNPSCQKPENTSSAKVCKSCGSSLLLRGRYSIIRPLSQGGFAKTFLAQDEDRRKAICVVKQFAPSLFIPAAYQKAVQLFNEEAEKLIHLEEHPQIPTLYAYFQEGNCLYLVQQFIKGETLMELAQKQTFNEVQIRELLGDILPLLQFIHERKVIHRDIKPDNIIQRENRQFLPVFGRGNGGEYVLIDFGVAKQWTGNLLSRQGTMTGTPGYAPIEQMRGIAYPASDLYSLAVTCIRLMTGIFPKDDGSDELYDNLTGNWLWREKLPEGIEVSPQLGAILDNLLSDYVKERYQSAGEVLQVLQAKKNQNVGLAQNSKKAVNQPKAKAIETAQKKEPINEVLEFEVIRLDARGKEINRQRKIAESFVEKLPGGVGLEMVSIPGGIFLMGSPTGKNLAREYPQHSVQIRPFFMGKFTVTQTQWKAVASLPKVSRVLEKEPAKFKGENRPIESVSWEDAIEFCGRLSRLTGKSYRLPSEAEWEYACRGGMMTDFCFGETIIPQLANYDAEVSGGWFSWKKQHIQETTDVGSFGFANDFGLYDMHGNVWEWCADFWHDNYENAPDDGRVWKIGGDEKFRVQRGGSWCSNLLMCRCAYRDRDLVEKKEDNLGFRVVC